MVKLETDISYIKSGFINFKSVQEELHQKLDGFIKTADKRYATKLVERLVYGFVAIILLSVVGTLIRLVVLQV